MEPSCLARFICVQEALNVKIDNAVQGVKSVRSRVTNVYPYLKEKITMRNSKDTLMKFLLNDDNYNENEYVLTDKDLNAIKELVDKSTQPGAILENHRHLK